MANEGRFAANPKLMPTQEELRKYELMLIFSGELIEAGFAKELDEVRKLLKESTQGISYEDLWGKRDFSFRIKKQARGYYAIFNFDAAPAAILELRSSIKLNQQVLRHLLITLPDDYQPGRYNELVLPEEKHKDDRQQKPVVGAKPVPVESAAVSKEPAKKPTLAGKDEEEQLKSVEKKLEQILENPDIDI
ncbi:MAG: 30S ribosomal protein S6 [Patescibacteria group bacterium]